MLIERLAFCAVFDCVKVKKASSPALWRLSSIPILPSLLWLPFMQPKLALGLKTYCSFLSISVSGFDPDVIQSLDIILLEPVKLVAKDANVIRQPGH